MWGVPEKIERLRFEGYCREYDCYLTHRADSYRRRRVYLKRRRQAKRMVNLPVFWWLIRY